jgi:DNA-binding NtrC family response regulator
MIEVNSPVHAVSEVLFFWATPGATPMRHMMEELNAELVRKDIPLEIAKRELERIYLEKVLQAHNGNQSAAARQLGMHRNTLSKKLEQHLGTLRYPAVNC